MGFEEQLQKSIFSGQQERTFIDKVLAKDDVNRLRDLIRTPELKRKEILEILYLISGTESKLLNYSDWDRYIILKFFVWIREFVKILEILFDYEDWLAEQEKTCSQCKKQIKDPDCQCKDSHPTLKTTDRTKQLLKNNKLLLQHNAKFLVELYLNIARTSMSVGGAGFSELLKNKFEIFYPNLANQGQTENKTGLFGIGRK